ncbi:MAG: GAF domain-containing protein [Anaerolineae bacterium]|nr:GAF domain-containing protein [Anaerolineae bacterium]MDW8067863.1 GAF domain-containing protein [Anaerolineae bacterium]
MKRWRRRWARGTGWLMEVVRELTSGLDLDGLARRALALAVQAVEADLGSLILVDEEERVVSVLLLREGRFRQGSTEAARLVLAEGLGGWVLRSRQAVRIDDVEADSRWRRLPEAESGVPVRAALCVPLISSRRAIGILTCLHPQPGYFDDDDLRALRFISDQATVALENAWLFALEEQRRHLADTLREIARALTATLDLDEVLSLILASLSQVVPHDSASIFLVEGPRLVIRAWHGLEHPETVRNLTLPVEGRHLMARVVAAREPLVCADIQSEEGWPNIPGAPPIRSWIGAPLVARGTVIGVLAVHSLQPNMYTREDAGIVAAFADHAAIAIANAQLLQQTQRQLEEVAFLHRTGQALAASLEMDDVLRSLLESVREHFRVEAASVALVDEQTGELVFRVATGAAASQVVGVRLKPGQGIAGWVAQSGLPVVVPSVEQDPRWYSGVDQETGFRTRTVIAVPIRLGREVLGVVEAINPLEGTLDEGGMKLLLNVAALAASAIQNARHFNRARDAEERYSSLFENSADPILITDAQGRITDVNRKFCQMLGYTREELLHRDMFPLTSAPQEAREWLERGLQGEDIFGYLEMTTREGQRLPFEVRATRIFHARTPYIQWVLHDITERRQLEKVREDLTHMIIHDLRNPLSSIMSSLELIRATVQDPTMGISLEQLFSVAERSGERLFALIDSILDIARLESGKAELTPQAIDVRQMVQEAVEQMGPVAVAREIHLDSDLPEGLPVLTGDRNLLLRTVINLLDNAIKFTPPGGHVRVEVDAPSADTLRFTVSDTGPGIPPEEQQRIFDRFVRLPHQPVRGTGIGLAFCKLAVEAHGGRIWVESQPGQGARFIFTLPIHPSVSAPR